MENKKLFGKFLRKCRVRKNISQRKMADSLEISYVYLSDIENGKCSAPSFDVIVKMIDFLELSQDETCTFYDYAAMSKNTPSASLDLCDYIMKWDFVRTALRTAKEMNATKEEWLGFIDTVKKHGGK